MVLLRDDTQIYLHYREMREPTPPEYQLFRWYRARRTALCVTAVSVPREPAPPAPQASAPSPTTRSPPSRSIGRGHAEIRSRNMAGSRTLACGRATSHPPPAFASGNPPPADTPRCLPNLVPP